MIWKPSREWIEESNVYSYITSRGLRNLEDFVRHTFSEPEIFWDNFVKIINLKFIRPYSKVLDLSEGKQFPKWFFDGILNIGNNILESSEVFIKWMNDKGEAKTITFNEVLESSKAIASFLRNKLNLQKGERVAVYMPMIPEIVPTMLGIIRAGLVFVPLFSGFGPEPIKVRLEDSEAKVIFTVDVTYRKGKEIKMLDNLKDFKILKIVVNREDKGYGEYDFKDVLRTAGDYVEYTSSEDPMMLIYTSGTTGKPKACVHTHGGFPIKAAADIYFHFDLKERQTLMWITDMGWMMGPWLVIGGLLLKGKIGIFEGYPEISSLIKFVEDMRVDVLGFSASLIRSYRRESSKPPKLEVKIAGNTGEPIDPESWLWLYEAIDKNPIINYSGGTEISGGIVGNYVIKDIKPSSFNSPSPGINAQVFDENGNIAPPFTEGELVVLSVWPGMTRGFWKDKKRYLETYWSRWEGVWVHGDLAYYDNEGYIYIVGRSDDTIKVAGKRIGPAEIESVINSHPSIVESACVGVPHELKGEVIYCFIVSKELIDENKIKEYISQKLGKALTPEEVFFVKDLPKTRNAKIMRRLIRAIILGKSLGDISALENPLALEELRKVLEEKKVLRG